VNYLNKYANIAFVFFLIHIKGMFRFLIVLGWNFILAFYTFCVVHFIWFY